MAGIGDGIIGCNYGYYLKINILNYRIYMYVFWEIKIKIIFLINF